MVKVGLFVAGVVIGVMASTLWMSMREEDDANLTRPAATATNAGAALKDRGDRSARRASDSPLPSKAGSTTAIADPADRAMIDDVVAELVPRLPYPVAPRGEGAIGGKVTTTDGSALAGVTVIATPESDARPAWQLGDAAPSDDPAARLRDHLMGEYRRAAHIARTLTDDDGVFLVDGLAGDKTYRLAAFRDGYSIRPAAGHLLHGRCDGDSVMLRAQAVLRVRCDVVGIDGATPERATIHYRRGAARGDRMTWSAESPELRLLPGTYEVIAAAGPNETWRSKPVTVTTSGDDPTTSVRLELAAVHGIHGRMRFPTPPQANVFAVHAMRLRDDATTNSDATTSTVSDDDIRRHGKSVHAPAFLGFAYTFRDLEPGRYMLAAGPPGSRFVVKEVVEVIDRLVVHDLHVGSDKREDHVVVRAFGPDGAPLADVAITAERYHGRNRLGAFGGGRPRQHDDGSYWIVQPDHLSARDRYLIIVDSLRYGRRHAICRSGPNAEATIHFEPPGELDVVVQTDGDRRSTDRAVFRLVPVFDEESPLAPVRPKGIDGRRDAEGALRFAPVAPGDYDLIGELIDRSRGRNRHPVVRVPIRIVSGRQSHAVTWPALHRLAVRVDFRVGDAFLVLRAGDPGAAFVARRKPVRPGQDVVFDDVPAGPYELVLPNVVARVVVPSEKTVAMNPGTEPALSVTVVDPDGPLGRAGLRTGDLVIGGEGTSSMSAEELAELRVRLVTAHRDVELEILRDGKPKTLYLVADDLAARAVGQLGGRLRLVRY